MTIENSAPADLNEILRRYDIARNVQKAKGAVVWPAFDTSIIENEIAELRQWKIVIDNQIACIWATTFDDPQIWEARNSDPSVYIHRIAANPNFKGQQLVGEIVNWSKNYAAANGKQFVRLDTVGENKALIQYYQQCGFEFLGLFTLNNTDQLPLHYYNAQVSLFQLSV